MDQSGLAPVKWPTSVNPIVRLMSSYQTHLFVTSKVLPSEWVRESTQWHIAVKESESEYGKHGYSYLWWHDRFETPSGELEVHTAVGNGAQKIFVIPALDMVVVHLAGRYNDPAAWWMAERLLLNYIIPAATGP